MKFYTGNAIMQSLSFEPTVSQPIDVRMVVKLQSDLIDINTWKVEQSDGTFVYAHYHGMMVAVVGETEPNLSKNGVYFLRMRSAYNTFGDPGWVKIGSVSGTSSVVVDNYSIIGEGNEQLPYKVGTIDGGIF